VTAIDVGLSGLLIGELVMLIAVGAMTFELGSKQTSVRALVMLHGVLVLLGVEVLLAGGLGHEDLTFAFGMANMFEFCVLGAAIGMVSAPTTRAALADILTPFLFAGAVTGVAVLAGDPVDASVWTRALRYLGLYYYVVAGGLILTMLLSPPSHAPAAALSLGQRLTSGMGLFWIVLQLVWWAQLVLVLVQRGDVIFSGGPVHVAAGVAALAYGVARTIREGRRRVEDGGV
jgi:hypothetical protein